MLQQAVPRFLKSNSRVTRYGVAIVGILGVLIALSFLHPVIEDDSHYIIFLLAVLMVAWYSGSILALITLALGAFVGNIFFARPFNTLKIGHVSDVLAMVFYLAIGFVIIYLLQVVKRRASQLATQITKQAEVERALRMSEDRFRLVTEALQGAVYDWDAAKDIAYRSPAIFDIVGYQGDEVKDTRKWWQNLMHPDDFEGVQQSFQKRLAEHAPIHSIEYRVRHKDGHYIWVWDKSRMIYNPQGELIRLIGCTLSIDERKQLRDSLTLSEERFRVAFENASDAMVISDAKGIVVVANDAYCQLYGHSMEEVIGKPFSVIFPPEARQQAAAQYQQIFHEERKLPVYESVVQSKDGTLRTVESRIGFVSSRGQRTYMLSVVRDLTARKQAEEALYSRYQLTSDLAQVVSTEDVAQVMVAHLMKQTGAKVGIVYVYRADDNMFELLYANTAWAASGGLNGWHLFAADPRFPMTDVVKHNKSLWFSTIEAYEAAYPVVAQYTHLNPGATVLLPLGVASEVFGEISLLFSEPQTFTEDEKAFITSLVFQCAQAIERARLAEKTQSLAVIEERHRLARDLHDNVSQLLFSSSVISEMLPRLLITKPDKALQQAEDLHLMVRGAMAEMRTLLWELRPESIVQTKLSGLLTQLAYAAESRQDSKVSLRVHAADERVLTPDVQIAFYRIAQEGIHNIFKHGHAAAIAIRYRQTNRYTALIIADDGHGFDAESDNAGFGLRNMRERATSIGASFDIKSRLGKGTRLRLLWHTPS